MEKVAHSIYGLPPSVSLNTFSHFGGLLMVSARNHRSFLLKAAALWDHQPSRNNRNGTSITLDIAKIQNFSDLSSGFLKNFFKHPPIRLRFLFKRQRISS